MPTIRSRRSLLLLAAMVCVASVAIANPFTKVAKVQPRPASPPAQITVSAAASLKDALTAIKDSFAGSHSDVAPHSDIELMLNFGASGTLELQIEQGAPADVFVSAAPHQMDALAAKGLILADTRVDLLRNELVLIAPRDSKDVTGFSDLGKAGVRVVAMGDPRSVPAGAYAQQVLQALGLSDAVKGKTVLGTDVRQVLADVETGSADAGLVYATDAAISSRVRVVADAPENTHMPIVYPAAVLRSSTHPDEARAFLQYLQSAEARSIFQKYGFRPVAK
jgi:molybdate transport system substrate-binding protein